MNWHLEPPYLYDQHTHKHICNQQHQKLLQKELILIVNLLSNDLRSMPLDIWFSVVTGIKWFLFFQVAIYNLFIVHSRPPQLEGKGK